MNALYLCCIYDVWFEVSKQLMNKYDVCPVYFIGWEGDMDISELHSLNQKIYTQTVEDAFKGNGFPNIESSSHSVLDEYLYKKYSFEILNGITMIDRIDCNQKSFPTTQRIYWFCSLIETWLSVIEKKKIDVVFSPSIPHRVFDYALYIACLIKDVRFIMFQMTPFGCLSLIIEDVAEIKHEFDKNMSLGVTKNDEYLNIIASRRNIINISYDIAQPDYMREQEKSYHISFAQKTFSNFKKFISQPTSIFKFSYSYYVSENLLPSQSKHRKYQQLLIEFNKKRFLMKLKNNYKKLTSTNSMLRRNDYYLLALHYQPEETSCPTGGFFAEQRQIVKLLLACLPDNIHIYIKEHKTQFHPDFQGRIGRNLNYYKDLQQLSNRIKFIDYDADPFLLIDNSLAVVTISGTIGWEAVIRGKPALIFGRAWFENMPGVFKIKKNSDLCKAYETIRDNRVNISKNSIYKYEEELSLQLVSAVHYKAYQNKCGLTVTESADNIVFKIAGSLELSER